LLLKILSLVEPLEGADWSTLSTDDTLFSFAIERGGTPIVDCISFEFGLILGETKFIFEGLEVTRDKDAVEGDLFDVEVGLTLPMVTGSNILSFTLLCRLLVGKARANKLPLFSIALVLGDDVKTPECGTAALLKPP
jgi:hypothetical protein